MSFESLVYGYIESITWRKDDYRQNNSAHSAYQLVQLQDMGAEYIGYSYVDGNEEIYWVPVEEVYDGDTGAVEYIPLSNS